VLRPVRGVSCFSLLRGSEVVQPCETRDVYRAEVSLEFWLVRYFLFNISTEELWDIVPVLKMGLLSLLCCIKRREGGESFEPVEYSHGKDQCCGSCIDLN
jgi:hypothetical protein